MIEFKKILGGYLRNFFAFLLAFSLPTAVIIGLFALLAFVYFALSWLFIFALPVLLGVFVYFYFKKGKKQNRFIEIDFEAHRRKFKH